MAGQKKITKGRIKVNKLQASTRELSKKQQKEVKGGEKSLDTVSEQLKLQRSDKGYHPIHLSLGGADADKDLETQ